MKKLKVLSLYQLKLQMRDLQTMFFLIGLPVAFYLVSAYMLKGMTNYFGAFPPQDFIIPSYIPITIANSGVMIFGLKLTLYREKNYFIRYKLLGFQPLQIAVSISITTVICQFIGILSLLLVAVITNNITIPFNNIINVILAIFIITLFQFSLGYFLSSILKKSAAYQTIGLLVFYFEMVFGGLTLPPELFGRTMTSILEIINPMIHGLYMLRGVWLEGKSILDFPLAFAIMGGLTIVLTIAASTFEKLNYNKKAY